MSAMKFDSLLISSKTRANTAVNDCRNQWHCYNSDIMEINYATNQLACSEVRFLID